VAPLRRKTTGAFTPKTPWLHYAGNPAAPLRRKRNGAYMPEIHTNRRCDRIKILGWDHNGFWLLLKRLEEKDRFVWPDSSTAVVTLDVEQLQWLLKGVDIAALGRHPKRNYARVS
jgi:hypothetical protein